MKELTTEEKAQVLIEAGVFAEDFVLCDESFINGAYAGYTGLKQAQSHKEYERLKELALGAANVAGRNFSYYDRKGDEELSKEQIDYVLDNLVTKEDILNAFWKGVNFED